VDPVSFDDAATELYGRSPAEFTAARDERAGQARAAGQKDVAAAIKKLSRPTVSAWLVNLLARHASPAIGELLSVGESLRAAQQHLDGEQIRELSGQRRKVIAGLVQEAGRLAAEHGQTVGAPVLREVETTLDAAVVDPHASAAVAAGRLTKPLAYAGVGGGADDQDADAETMLAALQAVAAQRTGRTARATAAPAAPVAAKTETPGKAAAKPDSGQAAARRKEQAITSADQARAAAASQAAEADAEAKAAEQAVATLTEQRLFLTRRIESLERELAEAEAEQIRIGREQTRAQRVRDSAARTAAAARRQLEQAEQRLARLREGG
jgi:hypothetical protein